MDERDYTPEQKARMIDGLNFKGMLIDDLQFVFTLPGYDEIELRPNGKNQSVTIDNLYLYVQLAAELTLNTIPQAEAFRSGFSTLISIERFEGFSS